MLSLWDLVIRIRIGFRVLFRWAVPTLRPLSAKNLYGGAGHVHMVIFFAPVLG